MSSGLRPKRSELAEAARGGAGQFAQSEGLEPRREQAKRDNTALVRAVTGTPGGAYLLLRWVRSSQGIFAGSAPPPSHHAGGSLRGSIRLLVLIQALCCFVRPLEWTLFIL